MAPALNKSELAPLREDHPFRRGVLRGLTIILPPLLTVVIFVWVWNTIRTSVLEPVTAGAREALVWGLADVRDSAVGAKPTGDKSIWLIDGVAYKQLDVHQYVPNDVYEYVRQRDGTQATPTTADALYRRYVDLKYMQSYYVIPLFLVVFILLMYLLGKFLAAGVGSMFWNIFEGGIRHLPFVRNVYSSVKQVTEFMFSESEIQYLRVVALEYPRKGIWSLAFVTSEGLVDIRAAAKEPVLAVMVPGSPVPLTGITVTVPRSQTVDLNLTIDQALQFIISCGVVVPPHQLPGGVEAELGGRKSEVGVVSR